MQFFKSADRLRNLPPSSRIYNLSGSSLAFFLAAHGNPFVMVEHTEEEAETLYKDMLFFRSIAPSIVSNKILFLPEPDGADVSGTRAEVIYNYREGDSIITSRDAFHSGIWTKNELDEAVAILTPGLEISRDLLERKLINLGYKSVSIVVEHGEFSRRGWIFDVFPPTSDNPVRAEFFGDSIDTLRTFDISSQKSVKETREIILLPASEPSHEQNIFSVTGKTDFFISDSISEQSYLYEGAIIFSRYPFEGKGEDAGLIPMGGLGIYHNERKSIYEFPAVVKRLMGENRILMVSSSGGQAERLKEVLMNGDVIAPVIGRGEIAGYEGNIAITTGSLSSGFFLPGLLILTEKEIFGERPSFRSLKKSKVSELLLNIDDLAIGDFVVHKDHGIGRFVGLAKREAEGDLMVLEYSAGDRLYLPLYGINSIKKYHAEEGVLPKIDRLGGKTWVKTKERVRKKIREMAEKLLRLYAEREVSKGFSFSNDTELHREFDGFFLYDETPDQLKAIDEIKKDMESVGDPPGRKRPMDRLLCGDVGYGKTEVAMRAAFKAVYDGRQVAVLVPTTLLCEQHYRTFMQRFSAFPVVIDYLSRFKPKKDQGYTIKRVAKGEVDILIGTHAMLGKDVTFHNLGLLVIDEEHRFGVAQKERTKELRRGVDVLTLTATPIPRTLNMALSGIRGMSLIETPPEERLSVRSIVSEFNEQVIKDAVERELERGGQTYFVHNRINDIDKIYSLVSRLAPNARVAVAHGRMNEKELDGIMEGFIDRKIDVLVSTAIVGSGLDIPNANTMIIDRADRMGLADLYQLRGRVGRSSVRAYAYFLIPGEDIITDEAKKRLKAVQDMSYLGAGFRLAMRDLEIRGTGNLLGPEQSGHIHAVGFDMYIEMLERSVSELRGLKIEEEIEPKLGLRIPAFIPEEFIEDVTLRLSIYRKIASAGVDTELASLLEELEDRFGKIPVEVRTLADIMGLKIIAKRLMIREIAESGGYVRFIFAKETKVSVERVLGLKNAVKRKIRFLPDGFELGLKDLPWDEACRTIRETLEKLG